MTSSLGWIPAWTGPAGVVGLAEGVAGAAVAKLNLYLANPRSLEEMKAFVEKLTGKPLSPEELADLRASVDRINQQPQ